MKTYRNTIVCYLMLCWSQCLLAQPNLNWSQHFGTDAAEHPVDIIPASNNTFTFLYNRLSPNKSSDFCLTKVDAAGAEIWTRCFGGEAADHATAMVVSIGGDYLI
ncbi:MAG: hypothetical protein AAFO94_20920, partial [Bacteroidota bacterium]